MKSLSYLSKTLLVVVFVTISIIASAAGELILQLIPSNYHGFNISCFGGKDGSIDLSVSQGTPPYSFTWSTGANTEDIDELVAGLYHVTVRDAGGLYNEAFITLSEPEALRVEPYVHVYPNGKNVSCFNCSNGYIALNVSGGAPPFSFIWNDNNPDQVHYSLPGNIAFQALITDANGCDITTQSYVLTEPAREDWTLSGNSGSNPSSQYIGTYDNKDVVFKTYNQERIRIRANGNIDINGKVKIDTISSDSSRVVFVDQGGVLRTIPGGGGHVPCDGCPCWNYSNRWVSDYCGANPYNIFNSGPGSVGIGMNADLIPQGFKLAVKGKIICEELIVKLYSAGWPDYVFKKDYHLMSLPKLKEFIEQNNHLPGIPSANELQQGGSLGVGEMQQKLLQKVEELTLYILEQDKKIHELSNVIYNGKNHK